MQRDRKWCSDFENCQMDIHVDGCVVGTGQASTSGVDVNLAEYRTDFGSLKEHFRGS
jgi:hypothetical protein